jgi:hypothetical protein
MCELQKGECVWALVFKYWGPIFYVISQDSIKFETSPFRGETKSEALSNQTVCSMPKKNTLLTHCH